MVPARSQCLLWVPSLPGSGTQARRLPPTARPLARGAQWSEARLASLSLASFLRGGQASCVGFSSRLLS